MYCIEKITRKGPSWRFFTETTLYEVSAYAHTYFKVYIRICNKH